MLPYAPPLNSPGLCQPCHACLLGRSSKQAGLFQRQLAAWSLASWQPSVPAAMRMITMQAHRDDTPTTQSRKQEAPALFDAQPASSGQQPRVGSSSWPASQSCFESDHLLCLHPSSRLHGPNRSIDGACISCTWLLRDWNMGTEGLPLICFPNITFYDRPSRPPPN